MVKLEKLTAEVLEKNKEKKLICYLLVKDYLYEMEEKYHCLSRIIFVADEDERRFGECRIGENCFPVKDAKTLREVDWTSHLLIVTSEYYWEIFAKLAKENFFPEEFVIYYFEDRDTAYYQHYLEKYKGEPLCDSIVFRSGPRDLKKAPYLDFSDNAKALFDYMVAHDYGERYRLIWIVGHPEEYQAIARETDTEFLDVSWSVSEEEEKRERYYRAVCISKYIFFTEAYNFTRFARKDQVRVQLWHAQGFKARVISRMAGDKYEYMPVMGAVYAEVHRRIFGLTENQMLITGIPKQDWVFHPATPSLAEYVGMETNGRCILWLPTVRAFSFAFLNDDNTTDNETGLPIADTEAKLRELDSLLESKKLTLVIKLHPAQKDIEAERLRFLRIRFLSNQKMAEKHLHVNQLMGYADALLSDYSSAATDYLLLDRPMGFALEDLSDFEKRRGFIFDPIEDWLPGAELYNFPDLCRFIEAIANGADPGREKRREVRSRMVEFEDDQNCRRLLSALGISP